MKLEPVTFDVILIVVQIFYNQVTFNRGAAV